MIPPRWLYATVLILQGLLFLPATSTAGAKAEADRKKIAQHFEPGNKTHWTWVFYGDSITQGAVHTHGQRAFPEIFAERVRYELRHPMDCVINAGNSGYSSVQLLNDNQYNWQVKRFNPNVVILMVGMNDMVNGGTPEAFKANVKQLVTRIRADGAIPVLQTSNTIQKVEDPSAAPHLPKYVERYEKIPTYMGLVQKVAQEENVILVDHYAFWSQAAAKPEVLDRWLGETIHPGAQGHLQMAVLLMKELGIYSPASACCRLAESTN